MASCEVDRDLLEKVKTILRRDLKLGADASVPDDMPFFGSSVDLDSLDMLLLVSSVEKEFGIKIPSEAVGKEVFENVTTLTRYIQNQGASPKPVDYLARLPHGKEFRFITKVVSVKEGTSAECVWLVNADEPFLTGHFPGKPIVPGVLIAEALAQTAGLAGPVVSGGGKLAHVDLRFDQPVTPPAKIALSAKFVRAVGTLQQFEVSASVNGTVVARGALALQRGES